MTQRRGDKVTAPKAPGRTGSTRKAFWSVGVIVLLCGAAAGLWWAEHVVASEDDTARAAGIALMHPEIADDPNTPDKLQRLSTSAEAATIRGDLARMLKDWTPGSNPELYAGLPLEAASPSTAIAPPSAAPGLPPAVQSRAPTQVTPEAGEKGQDGAPQAPSSAPVRVTPPAPQLGPNSFQ